MSGKNTWWKYMVRLAGINRYNFFVQLYLFYLFIWFTRSYIDLQFRKPLSKKYVKIFLLEKKLNKPFVRVINMCDTLG